MSEYGILRGKHTKHLGEIEVGETMAQSLINFAMSPLHKKNQKKKTGRTIDRRAKSKHQLQREEQQINNPITTLTGV